MAVNKQNYFSRNNSMKYCGASQYKAFMKCSAAAMAELRGEWKEEETTALLIGSYVDAYFEGTLDSFKSEHPEIFKKDGTLKAEYAHADIIIERVQRDKLFMEYMSGRKQVIKTGYIEGVPFKIKMDAYRPGVRISDLKIVRDFKPVFDEEEWAHVDFIRYWGYDEQAAIYQAVEGKKLPFYICAATKEKTPDLKVIQIPQSWIDEAFERVRANVELIQLTKQGIVEPIRCERCDYCKATKKLSRVISAEELMIMEG